MRETGPTMGRFAAPGAPLTFAVLLAFGAAACGGDSGSAEVPEAEAANIAAQQGGAGTAEAEPPAAAAAQELPAGVTAAMIEEGKGIFSSSGICFTCHGPEGKGVQNLGADLTDKEWAHSDGSYEEIVKTVTSGVSAEKSESGVPMPPKGGANLTDDQVKAVAAYVWSISHGASS